MGNIQIWKFISLQAELLLEKQGKKWDNQAV